MSVILLLALILMGCQSSDTPLVLMTGITQTEQNASEANFDWPISRLDYDLWRAARVDGWAMPYPIKPDQDGHYRGKGMMPDGRPLIVDAWPTSDGNASFTVNVKIGQFGDPHNQKRYLTELLQILKGDPMPKRGLNFTKDDVVKPIPQENVSAH